ncbi:MAG: GreA/GreB family elongation factor [Candidatus Saccharimonadales bacterium]
MNTTITDKTIMLSRKGLKELKKQIHQFEHDKKKISQSLREIDKTSGHEDRLDMSEKLSALEYIELEIAEKKTILANVKLLPSKRSHLRVALGSVVELIDSYGHFFRYTIVDSIEANPSDGRISTESPLGRSLIGRTVQDVVEWRNGNRFNKFQLVRIV